MEHSAQVGRWSIRFDPDLTANLYLQTAPFESDCTDCANFRAAKNQAFSPPFLPLLRRLGIDPSKPAELSHVGHTGQPMLTQGWLHFVGHLDAGADAWRPAGADTLRTLNPRRSRASRALDSRHELLRLLSNFGHIGSCRRSLRRLFRGSSRCRSGESQTMPCRQPAVTALGR